MTATRAVLLAIILPIACGANSAAALTFMVFGDMPYAAPWVVDGQTRSDFDFLTDVLAPAVRDDETIDFAINVGDIGRPEFACNDDWLRDQRAFWLRELGKPVFYTPGDHDWTDCDRDTVPVPSSEMQRLRSLRLIMFGQPPALDGGWHYAQQPGFPENAMWRRQDVQFVTLHVVGTNDGLGQIQLDDPLVARQQVARRQRAVRDWLATAAAAAKEAGAAALVVAMQADPFRGWGKESCRVKGPETCDAFAELRTAIVATARDLDRPMLVVHGDTAAYCLDQPFGADAPAGLWRLNGPGDFKVIDGARVTTSPGSAVPFQVTGLLTGPLAPGACQ